MSVEQRRKAELARISVDGERLDRKKKRFANLVKDQKLHHIELQEKRAVFLQEHKDKRQAKRQNQRL